MITLDSMIESCGASDGVKTVMKLLNAQHNTLAGNIRMAREFYLEGSDGNWYKLTVDLTGATPAALFTNVGRRPPTGG